MVTSCTYQEADDSRLIAVDSMLDSNVDSAYAMLHEIVQIKGKSNRAYYGLLYTQALSKTMQPINSDSLINTSLDYYSKYRFFSDDARRKYARSRILKGRVYFLMGKPDEALEYEMETFAYIDSLNPKEYALMGELHHQIAGLYYLTFSNSEMAIDRYGRAVEYYRKARKPYLMNNDLKMYSAAYARVNIDSALKYLNESLNLSRQLNDSSMIIHQLEYLSRLHYENEQYDKAKELALSACRSGEKYRYDTEIFYDLAMLYYKESNLDSLIYYANKYNPDTAYRDERYRKILLKNLIAKLQNNYSDAYSYLRELYCISDSIKEDRYSLNLYEIEKKYDKTQVENDKLELERTILVIVFIALLFFFVLIWYMLHRRAKQNAYVNRILMDLTENRREMQKMESELETLKNNIKLDSDKSENFNYEYAIRNIFDKYMENMLMFSEIKDLSELYRSNPQKIVSKLQNKITNTTISNDFWILLHKSVNLQYDNFLEKLKVEYPMLEKEELNLIALIALQKTNSMISVCMGYKYDSYIGVKNNRIKEKMGLNISLRKFIYGRIGIQ